MEPGVTWTPVVSPAPRQPGCKEVRPGRRDGKGGDVASLAMPVAAGPPRGLPRAPAQASPPRRVVAPGQGAGGCPPTATHASPRWLPVGPGRAPATRGSPAAAPCCRVQGAVLVPPAGGRGRCAARPTVPSPSGAPAPAVYMKCVLWGYHGSQDDGTLIQNK